MPLRALLYRRPSEPQTIQIVFDQAIYPVRVPPPPPGAALHAAHPCRDPRSRPDHAAARQRARGEGVRAEARRLDRGAAANACRRRRRSRRARCCRCAACRIASCTGAACAARSGRRSATTANALLCVAGEAPHVDRRVRDYLQREAKARSRGRQPPRRRQARRHDQAHLGARPGEPLGLVLDHRRAVVLLAADSGAAVRAGLSRRARGRASGRDESLAAVLAAGCNDLSRTSTRPRPGSTSTAPTCIATGSPPMRPVCALPPPTIC